PHPSRLPRGAPPTGLRYRKSRESGGAMTLEPEPGHAGGGTGRIQPDPASVSGPHTRRRAMTVQSKSTLRPSSVTTGAIAGSHKIYTSPEGRTDIRVPFREIAVQGEEAYRT